MSEMFFGPWHISVLSKEAWFDQRFVITGSANADGVYAGVAGTGPGRVEGDEWTVSCEWNDNTSSGWQPSDLRYLARYTVAEGLVVELGADDNFEQFRDGDYDDMVLVCVNQDPALAPLHPVPPFYDFSVQKEILDKNPHERPAVRRPDDEQRDDPPPDRPKNPPEPDGGGDRPHRDESRW